MRLSRLDVGDRVWFAEERNPYTVRAVSESGRWAACTKPFAALHTVMYTMVDFQDEVRGVDDRVLSFGYETDDDCRASLQLFEDGVAALSRRHPPIPLAIRKVEAPRED